MIEVGDLVNVSSFSGGVGLAIVLYKVGNKIPELEGYYEVRFIKNGQHILADKGEIERVVSKANGK